MAVNNQGISQSATNPLTAKIDFSKVPEGGGSGIRPKHLPEGEYLATIKNVEAGKSKAGNPQWVFHISPEEHPSAVYPYYCTLSIEQAWKIRNILVGVGAKSPSRAANINASKLVGKTLGIVLADDEYEGKIKSIIDAIIPASEVMGSTTAEEEPEDDDEDEMEEAPAPKARAKKKPAPEPEAEDDEDDEDGDDLDLDDL